MEEVFWSIVGDDGSLSMKSNLKQRKRLNDTVDTKRNGKSHRFQNDEDSIRKMLDIERPSLSLWQQLRVQIMAILFKRFHVSMRDLRGIVTQIIMPVLSLLFGLSLIGGVDEAFNAPPAEGELTIYR